MKYVALLAFHRIVASYSYLVSVHQDVIMDCIDDPDMSIRLQALNLVSGMVKSDNLKAVVERLIRQLTHAPVSTGTADDGRADALGIQPAADSDSEDPEEILKPRADGRHAITALPIEYRMSTISRIVLMCSQDTYANIVDFEWYLDILIQLVGLVPAAKACPTEVRTDNGRGLRDIHVSATTNIAGTIGQELRNIAVRVSTVRANVVLACRTLLHSHTSDAQLFPAGTDREVVLAYAAWVVGEYSHIPGSPDVSLESFIHPKVQSLPSHVISAYLQAIPKLLASLAARDFDWNSERRTMISLLIARVSHFLEPLTIHSVVEVQERSVQLLELLGIATQALTNQDLKDPAVRSGPLLLTNVLPQLFNGSDLNPVAANAQRKVPAPDRLDLEVPINKDLTNLLNRTEQNHLPERKGPDFNSFYNEPPIRVRPRNVVVDTVPIQESRHSSYQKLETVSSDNDVSSRGRFRRREQYKDDPFYIRNDRSSSGTSTPFHDSLRAVDGEDVDVDSIPIMELDLGSKASHFDNPKERIAEERGDHPKKAHIVQDETVEDEEIADNEESEPRTVVEEPNGLQRPAYGKAKMPLLQVDSSGLSDFPLIRDRDTANLYGAEKHIVQNEEMVRALAEVERIRLEMQRATERVEATDGAPAEGTFVKKRGKKRMVERNEKESALRTEGTAFVERKKKKKKRGLGSSEATHTGD